jgi:glycosyltransferase involved in cell wall biosynthesis
VIVVSKAAREADLLRSWDRPERVIILRNAVAGPSAIDRGPSIRAELGITPAQPVIRALDVLVQPSLADAFPTTLLEALAVGVPIVATAVGASPRS